MDFAIRYLCYQLDYKTGRDAEQEWGETNSAAQTHNNK